MLQTSSETLSLPHGTVASLQIQVQRGVLCLNCPLIPFVAQDLTVVLRVVIISFRIFLNPLFLCMPTCWLLEMGMDTAQSMFWPDKKLFLLGLEVWEGKGPKVAENGLGLARL